MTASLPSKLTPRYPDEVWIVSWDWAIMLGEDTISGSPTAVAIGLGGFLVDQVATTGTVTKFVVSGGGEDLDARIGLLCHTAAGERLGFNIPAPIRAR